MRHRQINILRHIALIVVLISTVGAGQNFGQKPDDTSAVNGVVCRTFQGSSDGVATAAAGNGDTLFVAFDTGRLNAVDAESGQIAWTAEIGGALISNLAATAESLVFAAAPVVGDNGATDTSKSSLRAVSRQTGITQWKIPVPVANSAHIIVEDGTVLLAGQDGQLAAYKLSDGSRIWTSRISGTMSAAPVYNGGLAAVGAGPNLVAVFSMGTGAMVRSITTKSVPTALAFGPDETIVIGDDRGNLTYRSLESGKKIWEFRNGARISHIGVNSFGILAASFDNFVYLISPWNGNVIWKRRFGGRISSQPLSFDKRAIVATYADGKYYLVDMDDGKVIQQAGLGEGEFPGLGPIFVDGAAAFIQGGETKVVAFSGCTIKVKGAPEK